jgi:methylmalonyl-CoA/ethylmalonyl-CoA epimerase
MGKIRHLAIAVNDPDAALKFYTEAFGFRKLAFSDNERIRGYFLTDGTINIVIAKFKTDQIGKGLDYVGLHHFGVYTDDADKCVDTVMNEFGGQPYYDEMELSPLTDGRAKRPDKFKGHEGILFDVADKPWPGTPTEFDR